ncbi:MAG: exodeoxyribonuclease VII small subunit [Acidithiobacillus sp.]|uniref:exodeoxyribonuclease VII small subunit n=1 Tax=Acidithiobacillus sp. TaxID=1872118 RepID=UPI0025BE1848|nr:exodeoxyribonuclease VII small subunit [Acidithiobacillus sp.]
MTARADPAQTKDAEASPDFAATLASLEETVRRLESGQLGLEDSVVLFQQGMELARRAQAQLQDAQQKVSILLGSEETPVPMVRDEEP